MQDELQQIIGATSDNFKLVQDMWDEAHPDTVEQTEPAIESQPRVEQFMNAMDNTSLDPSVVADLDFDTDGRLTNLGSLTDPRQVVELLDAGVISGEEADEWSSAYEFKSANGNVLDIESKETIDWALQNGLISPYEASEWQKSQDAPIWYRIKDASQGVVAGLFGAADNVARTVDGLAIELFGDKAEMQAFNEWMTASKVAAKNPNKLTPEQKTMLELFGDPRPLRKLGTSMVGEPYGGFGMAAEGLTEFSAGFIGAGAVNIGLKAARTASATNLQRLGDAAIRGAVADGLTVSKYNGALIDLLATSPELRRELPSWLITDKTDGMFERTARQVLEGASLGVAIDASLIGLKSLKDYYRNSKTRAQIDESTDEILEGAVQREEAIKDISQGIAQAAQNGVKTKEALALEARIAQKEAELQAANVKNLRTKARKGAKNTKSNTASIQKELDNAKSELEALKRAGKEYESVEVVARRVLDERTPLDPSLARYKVEFEKINTDEHNAALFNDIFDVAKRLGVRVEYNPKSNKASFADGSYNSKKNTITIYDANRLSNADKARVMLHELIHSVSAKVVDAYNAGGKAASRLTAEQRRGVEMLNEVFNAIKNDKLPRSVKSRLANPHELLAELSNPKVRDYLQKRNLWEKIVDGITRLVSHITDGKATNAYSKTREALYDIINDGALAKVADEVRVKNGLKQADELPQTAARTARHSDDAIKETPAQQVVANNTPITNRLNNAADFEREIASYERQLQESGELYSRGGSDIIDELDKLGDKGQTPNKHKTTIRKAQRIAKDELGEELEYLKQVGNDTANLAARFLAGRKMLNDFAVQLQKEIDGLLKSEGRWNNEQLAEAIELFGKVRQHGAMKNVLRGISSNIGRALNAHKIKMYNQEINISKLSFGELADIAHGYGGVKNIKAALEHFSRTVREGDFRAVNELSNANGHFLFGDIFYPAYMAGMLSNTNTHFVNIVGSLLNFGASTAIRSMAALGRAAAGDARQLNELRAGFKAFSTGFQKAFAIKPGISDEELGTFWKHIRDFRMQSDFNVRDAHNIAQLVPSYYSEAGRMFRENTTLTGAKLGWENFKGQLSDIITLPLRMLGATDDAMKTIIYEIERNAIANKIVSEHLSRGTTQEEGARYLQRLLTEPDLKVFVDGQLTTVREQAVSRARGYTFTTSMSNTRGNLKTYHGDVVDDLGYAHITDRRRVGGDGRSFYEKAQNTVGGLGAVLDKGALLVSDAKYSGTPVVQQLARYLFLFVNTPLNLAKESGRMTPLAVLSRKFWDDMAAGGSRRDVALGKMVFGTAMTAWAFDKVMSLEMVGSYPSDPALRESMQAQGYPENAIKFGDTWVSFDRLEPLGMVLSLAANTYQQIAYTTAKKADEGEEIDPAIDGIHGVVLAFGEFVKSKTYLKPIGDIMRLAEGRQSWDDYAAKLGAGVALGLAPFGALRENYLGRMAVGDTQMDMRPNGESVAEKTWDVIKKRAFLGTGGLIFEEAGRVPKRDILGNPMQKAENILGIKSYNSDRYNKVLTELVAAGYNGDGTTNSVELLGGKVKIQPSDEMEIRRIVGELGLEKALEEAIDSPAYQALDSTQVDLKNKYLSAIISKYYRAATQKWLEENGDKKEKLLDNIEFKKNKLVNGFDLGQAAKGISPAIQSIVNNKETK